MPHTPWRAEAIGNIKREVDARSDEDIYEVSDEALEAAAGTYIGDAADLESPPVKVRSCACPSE